MPAPDHPWYGPLGKLKRPGRTISDDLDTEALRKLGALSQVPASSIDDETVQGARDPSTASLYGGGVMRKPVRYD